METDDTGTSVYKESFYAWDFSRRKVFMDYQKNIKYFKSTDTHYYVGLVLLGLGGILFVLAYIFWTYLFPYQDMVGIALLAIGAIVAFAPAATRSSEKDIDEAILTACKNYEESLSDTTMFRQRLSHIQPILTGAYRYADATYCRRGKIDRKFRSDRYTVSAVLFTKYGVYISEKQFSLTDDREEENTREFLYTDIDRIEMENEPYRFANGEYTTQTHLVIYRNGEVLDRVPATPGTATQMTLASANSHIQREHAKSV